MILTALKKYKKTISELLKQLKKSFKKNRKQYYIGFSITGLLILSFVSFLIFRIKPNDDIFVAGSDENVLYANINPKFNVSFGQKEDTSKQWVRFESKSTVENPFDDEKVGFFKKVVDSISPKESLGVEMSLTGVKISETTSEKTEELDNEIQTVAEILGTDEIRTNTELVEMGREIGKFEGDQIISKETIVNPNVDEGIDLEYQILPGVGLKEEIVLRDLSSFNKECLEDINKCKLPLNEFYFDLKLDEGVHLEKGWYTVKGKSTVAYYFVDERGRYLSHFLPSFAVDDIGVKTFDVNLKIDETEEKNIYKISVIVDLEWLLSSDRVFPIRIDPSIVHDTKSQFDGGIFDRTESFDGARIQIEEPSPGVIDSNTVGYWSFDNELPSGFGLETGTVTLSDTIDQGVTSTVYMSRNYSNPVVVAFIPTRGGNQSADVRVRNVTSTSFEIFMQEPDNETHASEDISYLVVEEGAWNLTGNIKIEAGVHTTSSAHVSGSSFTGDTVTFDSAFSSNPAVFATLNTYNNSDFMSSVIPSVSTTSFLVQQEVAAAGSSVTSEDIAWIAISSGAGKIDGYSYEVGSTPSSGTNNGVDDTATTITFSNTYSSLPDVVVNGATGNGADGYWARGSGTFSTTSIRVYAEEDDVGDSERAHAYEMMSYAVFQENTRWFPSKFDDLSANNLDVTTNGTLESYDKAGMARFFDGVDDYIGVQDSNSLDLTSAVTLEAWIKPNRLLDLQTIVCKRSVSQYNYCLRLTGSNIEFFFIGSAATQIAGTSTSPIKLGEWQHVTATYDSSQVKIYINGELQKTSCTSGTCNMAMTPDSTPLVIGRAGDVDSQYFLGYIDEVGVSSVARSATEIMRSYTSGLEKYSGTYKSSEIDMESPSNIESFSWTENGVNTGDGETPYSTTGLVAQWNFNETSGTTAVSGGTCGTSCNGTLTGMTTTGQDAATSTGWTYDNRRWGQGAVMFDGSNDRIDIPDNDLLTPSTALTVSAWVYINAVSWSDRTAIISKYDATGLDRGYVLEVGQNDGLNGDTQVCVTVSQSASSYIGKGVCTDKQLESKRWYYVSFTFTPDNVKIYFDGVLKKDDTDTSIADSIPNNTEDLHIGYNVDENTYFNGLIDAVQIYSRALTASEILSNYQAGDIEFRYRISSDGSTWSSWDGGSETEIENFDDEYLYDSTDSDIVAYYPMDETVDNSCSGGEDVCNRKTTSLNGTSTGSTISDGKFGKARAFNGSSNFVLLPASSSFDLQTFTIDSWVYSDNFNRSMFLFEKTTNGSVNTQYSCFFNGDNTFYFRTYNSSSVADNLTFTTGTYFENGSWNHVACVYDGATKSVYVNGSLVASKAYSQTLITNPSGTAIIGAYGSGTGYFFNGSIDELTVREGGLSPQAINQKWIEGSANSGTVRSDTSTISMDSNSMYIDKSLQVKGNTLGSWSFDEVSGTGAYIKDESGHSADLTPSNTTYVKGRDGGALSFNGTNSNAKASSGSYVNASGDISVEMWLYPTSWATNNRTIVGKLSQFSLQIDTNGYVAWADSSNWSYANFGFQNIGLQLNKWQHLVVTKSGTTVTIYLDGVQKVSKVFGSTITTTASAFHVGCYSDASSCTGFYYSGYIDDLHISNIAIPYNEVVERYRAGEYHTVNKQLEEDFNLNGKTTVPFWIASDELGNNIDITYGNNKYVNYIPDYNTIGYWKMDEENGSGAYIKDYSGKANHGTPTSTTVVGGKLGKARSFVSGTNYINVGAPASYGGLTDITIDAWIYPTTVTGEHRIFDRGSSGSPNTILFYQSGAAVILLINNADSVGSGNVLAANQWYHIVATYDGGGGEKAIYVNGVKMGSGTTTQSSTTAGALASWVGCPSWTTCSTYAFNGSIDELRLSNTIRDESDIRSAYEIGKRTHPVNVEFKADLQSSNLISSSGDTSFTISETGYGTTDDIENLNIGDKIVVKENYNGTEYIAQGEVSTRDVDTGAVTVSSWESVSTFPSGGFTVNASVFKWQKEYIDVRGLLDEQKNSISSLAFRFNNNIPASFWIDDMKSARYLTDTMGITDEQLESLDNSGEVLVDDTSLFAQWDFNDTSGTTVDTGAGTCGSTCDGTLTGVSDTSGQDVAIGSGWTGINNRWGVGGLMLEGTDDYVNIGDINALDSANALSACTWVKPSSDTDDDFILSKADPTDNWAGFMFLRDDIGQSSGRSDLYKIHVSDGVTAAVIEGSSGSGKANEWTHVCFTYTDNSSTGLRLYVNGVEDVNSPASTVGINDFDSNNANLTIGRYDPAGSGYFGGVIDSTSLFTRVLTASEISQNYGVGYQESVLGMEGTSSRLLKGNIEEDPGLIAHYPLDETNGDLAGDDIFDMSGNGNDGEINGSGLAIGVVEGVVGNARDFNGSDDYISLPTSETILGSNPTTYSTCAWVKQSSSSATHGTIINDYYSNSLVTDPTFSTSIVARIDSYGLGFATRYNTTNYEFFTYDSINDDTWHHVCQTVDKTNLVMKGYLDGSEVGSIPIGNYDYTESIDFTIGSTFYNNTMSNFFDGSIDDVRIYSRALGLQEISNLYSLKEGNANTTTISSTDISTYTKIPVWIAGDKLGENYQLTYGESAYANYEPDSNTVGYWKMDGENLSKKPLITDHTIWENGQTGSIGKFAANGDATENYRILGTDPWGKQNTLWEARPDATSGPDGGWNHNISSDAIDNTKMYRFSVWVNRKVTGNGNFYLGTNGFGSVDGVYQRSDGVNNANPYFWIGAPAQNTWTLVVGHVWPSGSGTGSIHTDSGLYTVSGGKIGSITSDFVWRPETTSSRHRSYLYYSTNTATRQQWVYPRVDVIDGTEPSIAELLDGSYAPNYLIEDSSGNGNDGLSMGTNSAEGKLVDSRYFNGDGEHVQIPAVDASDFNFTSSDFTVDYWINLDSINNLAIPVGFGGWNSVGWYTQVGQDGNIKFILSNTTSAVVTTGVNTFDIRKWHHLAFVRDGTSAYIYMDGARKGILTGVSDPASNTTLDFRIGSTSVGTWFVDGKMDEVRISNTARTAEEIRQAYEVGLRTKTIDVDFKADLQSGNLISDSSDTSFTISETSYGTGEEIENLSVGDTIIITENYEGTEYKAQGEIAALNTGTGAVTVTSWKTGSTFPSGGYTTNATVFKWQRVYIDLWKSTDIEDDNDAVTKLTVRKINDIGSNLYIDDIRAGEDLAYIGETQYFQYKSIFTTYDNNVTPYISTVQLDYSSSSEGPTNEQLMRHGKWFDSNGAKQNFWWIKNE